MSDALKLNYWKHSWPLTPEICPCDLDFCDFIDENHIREDVVFHFGTGDHHVVARRNMSLQPPNQIVAVTASEPEYAAYIRFAIDNPHAANHYKVIFLDIYTLSPRILPNFNIITLFHLCEFYKEQNSAYAPLDDKRLLDLFISKLQPDGRIIFYRGSSHAEKMLAIVTACVEAGELVFVGAYKTLLVYRKPDKTSLLRSILNMSSRPLKGSRAGRPRAGPSVVRLPETGRR